MDLQDNFKNLKYNGIIISLYSPWTLVRLLFPELIWPGSTEFICFALFLCLIFIVLRIMLYMTGRSLKWLTKFHSLSGICNLTKLHILLPGLGSIVLALLTWDWGDYLGRPDLITWKQKDFSSWSQKRRQEFAAWEGFSALCWLEDGGNHTTRNEGNP